MDRDHDKRGVAGLFTREARQTVSEAATRGQRAVRHCAIAPVGDPARWSLCADTGLVTSLGSSTTRVAAAPLWMAYASESQDRSEQGSSGSSPAAGSPAEPARRKRSCVGGCLRLVFLLLLILVEVAVIVAYWPRIEPVVNSVLPGLRRGTCRRIVPEVTSEIASGDALICQFGLADVVSIRQLPSRDVALQRIADYAETQQALLSALTGTEGLRDRSTWQADAAIYAVGVTLSGEPVSTREGVLLYRDRYLIQARLSNWHDRAALDARWDALVVSARELIDARFK